MALARLLAMRNLQQKLSSSTFQVRNPFHIRSGVGGSAVFEKQGFVGSSYGMLNKFTTGTMPFQSENRESDRKEVAVQSSNKGKKKWRSLLPFSRKQRKRSLWKDDDDDDFPRGSATNLIPSTFNALFPPNLSNALFEAAENMNKLFDNITPLSSHLLGRVKETDDYYKLRYEVPGLSKNDIKITVDDGVLKIKGQHKEEAKAGDQCDDDDDEYWYVKNYGYYNTSLTLPDDAKIDDIKAEMKDGVLTIMVPKSEKQGKDVKEVEIR